jgi:DnaJ-class molecular chaperone
MSPHAALVLIVAGAVIGYLAHLYVHPFGPCRKCSGRGTNRGSTRRAFGTCRRCKGTRTRQRLGSRALHRAIRAASAYRHKED